LNAQKSTADSKIDGDFYKAPKVDEDLNLNAQKQTRKRIGIIGYGHLGQFLEVELRKSSNFCLQRIWNRTEDRDEGVLPLNELNPPNLADIDLVIEVAHPDIIKNYAKLILEHADLLIGSQSALAEQTTFDSIQEALKAHSSRAVFIPSDALWGAKDIRKMADLGILKSLTITMLKHPNSFKVIDPLKELCERAKRHNAPVVLYDGPVRMLCPLAPNDANTVSICAIVANNLGFDNTRAKLIADPGMLNWHIIEYETISENGFITIVRRQNPTQPGGVSGEATYFSFLSSVNETLYKPPGFNIC